MKSTKTIQILAVLCIGLYFLLFFSPFNKMSDYLTFGLSIFFTLSVFLTGLYLIIKKKGSTIFGFNYWCFLRHAILYNFYLFITRGRRSTTNKIILGYRV